MECNPQLDVIVPILRVAKLNIQIKKIYSTVQDYKTCLSIHNKPVDIL